MALDTLDETGLKTATYDDLFTFVTQGDADTPGLYSIFGSDINLNSNSPDGQFWNIAIQMGLDVREIIGGVYNSFDPDKATGIPLKERCAINNVIANGGSFTIVPVDITVNKTLSLQGLDSAANDADGTGFTISDDSGNNFILLDSVTLNSGTTTVDFRAQNIGQVETTLNTITNIVTVILGVISVNNSTAASQIGTDEEKDLDLRIRRERSPANGNQGFIDGLMGSLLDLTGVTDCQVFDNQTTSTNADGILANGVWVIVEGGANTDIANVMYSKLSTQPMKGSLTSSITASNGQLRIFKFDRPASVNLHIKFDIQTIISGTGFDQNLIKSYIASNLKYKISKYADTSPSMTDIIATAISEYGGGGIVLNTQIGIENSSGGIDFVSYIAAPTKASKFVVSPDNISISVLS